MLALACVSCAVMFVSLRWRAWCVYRLHLQFTGDMCPLDPREEDAVGLNSDTRDALLKDIALYGCDHDALLRDGCGNPALVVGTDKSYSHFRFTRPAVSIFCVAVCALCDRIRTTHACSGVFGEKQLPYVLCPRC